MKVWMDLMHFMGGYKPHPKIDKPLSIVEAIEAIEREKCSPRMKNALLEALLNNELQVWLCWDGRVRYQYVGG
ncbi:MAG: hypothetical protein MRT15_10570 [archaeon YNP-LCB-003-016]|uniref:hypothetical protein n=1 Tax=Candidatus Culexarchaeum yellowstonense TaxID=2928963 RepID=UPI0026ED8266|nr:hypothetical protein [Candidatus Culexarchaeum yellowstonense]MCR6692825.1 hypothetical protein [Candidatus Culexarchaeum yellowstonense]